MVASCGMRYAHLLLLTFAPARRGRKLGDIFPTFTRAALAERVYAPLPRIVYFVGKHFNALQIL